MADGRMEIRGAGVALLDEPLRLGVRAAPAGTPLRWRARVRDDDGRVWRAEAASPAELDLAWAPAKAGTGPVAALLSLRPVEVEVRAEAPDGRAAARTITRRLVADGVRLRRWRDGLAATLHLPPPAVDAVATVIADTREEAAPDGAGARGEAGPEGADLRGAGGGVASAAALAAPLLASRGVVVLVVGAQGGRGPEDPVGVALERLAAVPATTGAPEVLTLPLPPGVPARGEDGAVRRAAWDALLGRLGARHGY